MYCIVLKQGVSASPGHGKRSHDKKGYGELVKVKKSSAFAAPEVAKGVTTGTFVWSMVEDCPIEPQASPDGTQLCHAKVSYT